MPPTYKRKRASTQKTGQTQRVQAVPDEALGLPALTEKQEAFVRNLLAGQSAVEAYREAYNATNMSDATVRQEASRLKRSPQIAASVRYFQRLGIDERKINLEDHLAELARGREMAYDLGQASAGIQAEHYRGKAAGLYEDKYRLEIGLSDETILAQIQGILGEEAAQLLGEAMGKAPAPDIQSAGPEVLLLDYQEVNQDESSDR